ncbi:nucleotidyltransferase substrate binding protein [Salsuginibacillus kocurii]|uniref:nucleotidyltransferase substrate binding protein n=1 Tax=Salsuginibacillus kocurii TaxID=427078 RepID=UPI0003A00F2D|nr:nucleotidyltransferase substrate binding protein [Salsuginibacillus kocurii]
MEGLRQRLEVAETILASFQQLALLTNPSEIERDAAIQRFEFSFEACWKAAKQFLYDMEGLDVGSPKGVVRSCREVQLLDEEEAMLALEMVNDRNLPSIHITKKWLTKFKLI